MQGSWQNPNPNQANLSPLYKSWAGYQQMMHWYNHQFARLTVNYQALQAQTRFGPTHVMVAGDTKNPPLVLLPTPDDNASMWFNFLPTLLQRYRLYIPDVIGAAGRSGQYMPAFSSLDYGLWLLDTLAAFNLLPADIVAYRYSSPILFKAAAVDSRQIRRAAIFAPIGFVESAPKNSRLPWFFWNAFWFEVNKNPATARKAILALCHKRVRGSLDAAGLAREAEMLVTSRQALNIDVTSQLAPVLPDYELAALRCPTALYFGADDMLFNPLKQAEIAWRLLPHAKIEIVPEAGGMFLIEKPEFVVNAINQFFN